MKNIINKLSSAMSKSALNRRGLSRFCALFLCVPCACVALLSSCGKEPTADAGSKGLEGEWQLESFADVPASEEEIAVYIKFEKGRFELFQKLGGGHYSKYDGTYSVSGSVLSGKYSDGVAFGSNYRIEIEGDAMTMHSIATSSSQTSVSEVCVYVRASIPDSVRRDAADYSGTKSSESLDNAVNLPKFPWNGNLLRAM